MHTVVSASIGTTPRGLPRSRGSTCCSTEAKYELKSTSSERSVIVSGPAHDPGDVPGPPQRGMVIGRSVASMNLRRKTSGSAMSGIGSMEPPVPVMRMVPKLRTRPQKPCSTRSASTFSSLISTVSRLMKPNFAITRRLVIASSVEWTLIHAAARKKRPTTATSNRMPSTTSPACDHHETRARCSTVSPGTRESSMYDMSAEVRRLDERAHDGFEGGRVLLGEAFLARAVEVEHAEQPAPGPGEHHRYHELAPRRRIAGDVPGERVHVRHDHRAALRGGRAAHALADRNPHARRLSLEGPEHELFTVQPVEAGPVELGQRVIQQRGEVGGIRKEIALALEERARHGQQLLVEGGPGKGMGDGGREHGAIHRHSTPAPGGGAREPPPAGPAAPHERSGGGQRAFNGTRA